MPILTFDGGCMTPEKKKELIVRMTAAAAGGTGIPEDTFIVLVREYPDESIGVGGKTLVEVKAERAAAVSR